MAADIWTRLFLASFVSVKGFDQSLGEFTVHWQCGCARGNIDRKQKAPQSATTTAVEQ